LTGTVTELLLENADLVPAARLKLAETYSPARGRFRCHVSRGAAHRQSVSRV